MLRDRVGAAMGAAFVVLIFVGSGMSTAGTTQSGHLTGGQVLNNVAHQHASGSATVGFVLEILGFVAFLLFLGWLTDGVLGRTPVGQRTAAGAAVAAGVSMLAIKLGSAAPIVALNLDRHTLTPQLAQLLNDINGAAFVISWLPFAVFVGALASALHGRGVVGRPTAFVGYVLGGVGVVLALIGVRDITNAAPVAFLLGTAWLLVVCVRLAVKPGNSGGMAAPAPSYDANRVAVSA
ncbi:MAG TPA: hypothetical protein VFH66_00435 [Mycobacteriales bacterium]|nr:hypothetical protein [Mycobacteriales bacterium]